MGTHDLSTQPRTPALSGCSYSWLNFAVGVPLELGVGSGLREGEGGRVLGLQGGGGSIPASGAGIGTIPIAEGGEAEVYGRGMR